MKPLTLKFCARELILKQLYFVLFCILFCSLSTFSNNKLDGIIAVIGDEIILRSELDAYILLRVNNLENKPDSATLKQYRGVFLKELIDGKVLLAHAKQDSTILVTNQEVDIALKNHINALLQQNNIPMDSLESVMKQQGTSLPKFKNEARRAIKEQIYKQKLQQTFLSSIKVNKKDVVDFYNQYKDSLPKAGESILLSKISLKVAPTEKAKQAAYEKINLIKQKIDNGEKFEDVAKKYSESPDAANGGDLGFISKGSLSILAFEERAFSLSPGQTSEPFETPLGFHIVNVIEKKDQNVHIRQIFVNVAPAEQQIQNMMAMLDSIRNACKSETDFKENVKKFSQDNVSKNRSGSLGWSSIFELSGTIKNAIDSLPKGSITQPIREDNTLSIYRVDDRVTSRQLTIEDDYGILSEKTRDILAQKKIIDLVKQWRDELYVDIREQM